MLFTTLCLAIVSLYTASVVAQNNNTRLWYTTEAEEWTEALPIGNGRLGAMVFGGIEEERIQLNEETVWHGGPMSRINQNASQSISTIREMLANNQFAEAEAYADLGLVSTPQSMRHYETLGDIEIYFDGMENITNSSYVRWLDLETATAGVRLNVNRTTVIERELFSSAPDNVIVHRLTATGGTGKLSFQMRIFRGFGSLNVAFDEAFNRNGETTYMLGGVGSTDPINFAAGLTIQTDGNLQALGDFLVVNNATEAIAYLTASTTYRADNPLALVEQTLTNARQFSYADLRQRHVSDYQALYNRCTLTLDSADNGNSNLSTIDRLNRTQAGDTDLGLISLQFQYGRYLLISSSRPGTLPATLQGIWNEDFMSAWGSKFTININTEMNYWPAEVTNVGETQSALFEHLVRMRESGMKTAKQMYNASGWVVHHNTDIWADTAPQDRYVPATYWTMSSGWLSTHILEHFFYTGNTSFLVEYLSVVQDSIQFYLDTLQPYSVNGTEYLVTNPSVSPENTYLNPLTNTTGSMTVGATVDIQILRQLFGDFTRALSLAPSISVSSAFLARMNDTLSRLPPNQISERYNTLQEWIKDYEETEPGHRHISHLYGLHPGSQITPNTPRLFAAARRTLDRRLGNGGAGTGWSRAWTISFEARLLNATAVARNTFQFHNTSTYPNLLDAHPPFQIDGNMGFTAGVAEALLQSHVWNDTIGNDAVGNGALGMRKDKVGMGNESLGLGTWEVWLMPALPESWERGHVSGLRARGGWTIRMSWEGGRVRTLRVESGLGGWLVVRSVMPGREVNGVVKIMAGGGDSEGSEGDENVDGEMCGYEGFEDEGDGSFSMPTVVGGVYTFGFEWET